jgi:hypothetical protein
VTYPDVTIDEFMHQIARHESSFNWDLLDKYTGAGGYYQIEHGRWVEWAPKVLGTDPRLAIAGADIPLDQWVPPMTHDNQQAVALWRFTHLFSVFGDWRRVAAAWNKGKSVGYHQPGDIHFIDALGVKHYYWHGGALGYTNNVTYGWWNRLRTVFHVSLGYPKTTRATILPAVLA